MHQKYLFYEVNTFSSLQLEQSTMASGSSSWQSWVGICVIVSSSITALKSNNIICNNKNKLASCHLWKTCTYSSVFTEGSTKTTHRRMSLRPEHMHLATVCLPNESWLGFQALWSPKYISKYTSGCVSLLFTAKWFMGILGEKREGWYGLNEFLKEAERRWSYRG